VFGKLFLLTPFVLLLTVGITQQALGVPLPSESLKVGTVIDIGKELAARSSMYNPRSFGGKNYVVQINVPQCAAGCYPAGSTAYEALADIGGGAETRMAGAFPAAGYVLLSGGAGNDYFSRIDPNLNLDTRVFATTLAVTPSSYDWVDDDTIIHNSYKSGLRNNLYLTDIHPDPFQVTANTRWNANGYVASGTTTRIRNVRVGDIYSGYAYYGDAGVKTAGFWAINLATGVPTRLGTVDVTGDGSWGLWTVKEVDGFLYVHTTHNGIYVFTMTDATTLGTLQTIYTKERLDALAEDANPNWGFDVVDGGARMLLSAGVGRVIEIIDSRVADAPNPPTGAVNVSQTSILSWSAGERAASHDVYFAEDANAVADANTTTTDIYCGRQALDAVSFDPGNLEWGKTYYWRIDEVNAADPESPWKGAVWTFTTADFIVVDDFETYTDDWANLQRIFQVWIDGGGYTQPEPGQAGNGSGAVVGTNDAPWVELKTVHSGRQAMPMAYNNVDAPYYSEAQRTWTAPQDWTADGADTLVLYVQGLATNSPVSLYVALQDSAGHIGVATCSDPAAATATKWIEWPIPLSEFVTQGVNVAGITTMYVGAGDPDAPKAGGAGSLFIDDIRLIRSVP
jgi:hypothetical protein